MPVLSLRHGWDRVGQGTFDMHFAVELGVVLSGRLRRRYRGWEADLSPGQAWLIGIWEPHGCEVIEAPCTVAVFVAYPSTLMHLNIPAPVGRSWLLPFTVAPAHRPQIGPALTQEPLRIGRRARHLTGADRDRSRFTPEPAVQMLELLVHLCRDWQPPASAPQGTACGYARIDRAVQLALGVAGRISVAAAAGAAGMSRTRFQESFHELMGISFGQFALRHRLNGAAGELVRTDAPLKSVALHWGFTDASHLHKRFVQHYRCTPSAYRRRVRGEQP
ncbi:MAG: helix-turn-helix transcriptional regulator [Kiritimatiellae bacterium]|nr:helix-turn-helix transcriptional regulator [Kiritimatiellia bacterium]